MPGRFGFRQAYLCATAHRSGKERFTNFSASIDFGSMNYNAIMFNETLVVVGPGKDRIRIFDNMIVRQNITVGGNDEAGTQRSARAQ